MATVQFLITRGTGDYYSQSFDIWAQSGRYPLQEGDGTYVANVPIEANATSVSYTWTLPGTGTYYGIAIPIRHEMRGIPVKATNV